MAKCVFCDKTIIQGRGITLVTLDGKTNPFCSAKCENNFKLKRNPKKVRWAKRVKKQVK